MIFKETRLVYEKDFGDRALDFLDEAWGDIRSAGSTIWGKTERGLDWAGHNLDSLYIDYVAYDKPDPLEESTVFDDSYEYYHDLEKRYFDLFKKEQSKYKRFESELFNCELLDKKIKDEIALLTKELTSIPSQIEQYRKSMKRYHSSTPAFDYYNKKITASVERMTTVKKDISLKRNTTFDVTIGNGVDGKPLKEPLSISSAIEYLKLEMKRIEPEMDYYEINMRRARFWASRVLDIRDKMAVTGKELEKSKREFNLAYQEQLLKRFEEMDYDFDGRGDDETLSRKVFAIRVINMCRNYAFQVKDLKWPEIFKNGADIDYDGRVDLEYQHVTPAEVGVAYTLTGNKNSDQNDENIKVLSTVENWIKSKK